MTESGRQIPVLTGDHSCFLDDLVVPVVVVFFVIASVIYFLACE